MSPEEVASLALQSFAGDLGPSDQLKLERAMAADAALRAEIDGLREIWKGLGELPLPQPSPALRARFYQKLHASPVEQSRGSAGAQVPLWKTAWKTLWKRGLVLQCAAGLALFLLGIGVGQFREERTATPEVSQLKNQVEGLRQTVALSLMDKQSASSRLEGIAWGSQVDRPDQEFLTALLTTLNHDQNINVRLASLDALERFTSDAGVRKALEQSIPTQQSPLLQIALIDALVNVRDNGAAREFKQLSADNGVNAAVRERARWAVEKLSLE